MYVAHHRHRRRDVDHITLLHEQFFRLGAYRLDEWLGEELFAVELFDALVQVDAGCTGLVGQFKGGGVIERHTW